MGVLGDVLSSQNIRSFFQLSYSISQSMSNAWSLVLLSLKNTALLVNDRELIPIVALDIHSWL